MFGEFDGNFSKNNKFLFVDVWWILVVYHISDVVAATSLDCRCQLTKCLLRLMGCSPNREKREQSNLQFKHAGSLLHPTSDPNKSVTPTRLLGLQRSGLALGAHRHRTSMSCWWFLSNRNSKLQFLKPKKWWFFWTFLNCYSNHCIRRTLAWSLKLFPATPQRAQQPPPRRPHRPQRPHQLQ